MPSGWRIAVVSIPETSDPAAGSVRPKQPSFSPLAIGSRYVVFCSSEPNRRSDSEFRPTCTEINVRNADSPRSISSQISASHT